jgi:two-component system cell cycle sensor histidine kinase/response regulator CckA
MQRSNDEPRNSIDDAPSWARHARSLFQAGLDSFFIATRDGRIIDVNAATEHVTGRSRKDLVGSATSEHFTQAEQVRDLVVQVSQGRSVGNVPLEIRHADGRLTPVLLTAVALHNAAGEVEAVFAAARDLTELKRAEEQLRESEARFRTLFMIGADADLLVTEDEGRLLEVNDRFLEMFGYTRDEVVGRTSTELGMWAIPEARQNLLTALRSHEQVRDFELLARRKGGETFWVLYSVSKLQIGESRLLVGAMHDITERKRTEESLRLFRELVDHANDAIEVVDPETGRYLDVNRKGCELHGYTREEYLALSISDMDPRFAPGGPTLRTDGGQLHRAGSTRFEAEHRRKDGSAFPVEINLSLVRLDRDYLVAVVRDITERRHAEEERRRLAAAIEQAAEGIVITDAGGVVQYVNPAFEDKSGYSRAEAAGRDLRSFAAEAHLDRLYPRILETAGRVGIWQGRFNWPRRDGSSLATDAAVSPVRDAGGAIVNFVVLLRDVTDQVALEAQLLHAQKMEAIGRLAGGVAHDFNNLLQAMLSYTQLIRSQRHEPEPVATLVHELEHHVQRGASLTRQLLLFSRRETMRPERLDLNDIVGTAATMVRRLVHESVIVAVELAPGALPIDADRGQLEQVLMNLVVNASDAMPEGGRLVLKTGVDDPAQVWFEAEDTGHGIPDETRPRIFEPFFTTKESGKGTGLGLSVVHGIVSQHHGRVELDTEEGRGARFRIVLPRAGEGEDTSIGQTAGAPADLPAGAGERILLVEDEASAREGLRRILTSLGYEVVAVGSGAEAGRLSEDPPFALLLSDLMLPDVAGHGLAAGLQDRWPSMRVILMSGYTEDEVLLRCTTSASVRFLQKPIDMATLAREIRAALEGPPNSEQL